VVSKYIKILLYHKKECHPVSCHNMGWMWDNYVKWNKPGTGKQVLIMSFICGL
jgi:hypothetical protein